jgi:hypothetical protein
VVLVELLNKSFNDNVVFLTTAIPLPSFLWILSTNSKCFSVKFWHSYLLQMCLWELLLLNKVCYRNPFPPPLPKFWGYLILGTLYFLGQLGSDSQCYVDSITCMNMVTHLFSNFCPITQLHLQYRCEFFYNGPLTSML